MLTWTNDSADSTTLRERHFRLTVAGEEVPGVLWTPPASATLAPLVLAGHGYGMSKLNLYPDSLSGDLVLRFGIAVAAIDLPLHGERRPADTKPENVDRAWTTYWREHGAARIASEFCAARDALGGVAGIDTRRVGYWGLSLGTQYGIGVLAECLQARAAVLGLFGLPEPGRWMRPYARGVTCPVFFIQQLSDEMHSAESTAALFNLLETRDKKLHTSEGGHTHVPPPIFDQAYAFLAAHLRQPGGGE